MPNKRIKNKNNIRHYNKNYKNTKNCKKNGNNKNSY